MYSKNTDSLISATAVIMRTTKDRSLLRLAEQLYSILSDSRAEAQAPSNSLVQNQVSETQQVGGEDHTEARQEISRYPKVKTESTRYIESYALLH